MPYRQGEVLLVPFPWSDLSRAGKRPALVVSANWYNGSRDDCIFAAITSSIRNERDEILIQGAEVRQAGLSYDSVVRVGKLFTLDQSLIDRSLGALPRGTLNRVLGQIQDVFRG
jgi:mRNA interferase MazF